MTNKPKRRFWQIHLSTAIVLMLLASGLLGLNVQPRNTHIEYSSLPGRTHFVQFGWPLTLEYELQVHELGEHVEAQDEGMSFGIKLWAAVSNCILGVIFLLFLAMLLEYLIRRREARKP